MPARRFFIALFALLAIALSHQGLAANASPLSGTHTVNTTLGFNPLRDRLEAAVVANGMFVVTRASASRGAAGRGIAIPGNLVIGVYRNDYAVRMLKASVPAGIEAPLRFYVTENSDGTASLTWREPSAVFAPYGNADLDRMAAELDAIWQKIVTQATGG